MPKLLIANWKANPETLSEAKKLFNNSLRLLPSKIEAVFCPPAPFLSALASSYRGRRISFGVQDISVVEGGAHTGEYTASQARSAGASYVILGHSERLARGETREDVNTKIKNALRAGLTPVVCVGENERDPEGKYLTALEKSIMDTFKGLGPKEFRGVVVAYEPVWAIGRGEDGAISPEKLHETALFIRKVLSTIVGVKTARSVRLIYGGSVAAENASKLFAEGEMTGFLVGQKSLHAKSFAEIGRAILSKT